MFIESTDIDGQKSEVMDITNDNDQNVLFFFKYFNYDKINCFNFVIVFDAG